MTDSYPRAEVGVYPTPLQKLPRLSSHVGGADLWVKRDDLTGLAFGGSKTRALGTLLGQAISEGADTVITCGPTTSNHVRLTAAAANKLGLRVVLVLKGTPGSNVNPPQGNMLLNNVLKARLVYADAESLAGLEPVMADEALKIQARGGKPFIIPGGGYSPVGALGYIDLVRELVCQADAEKITIDVIVTASGSGCIQSGLLLGCMALDLDISVIGMTINRSVAELKPRILHDVQKAAELIGVTGKMNEDKVIIMDNYLGPGYAISSEAGGVTLEMAATMEGLLLDPCYTAKAMTGAVDLAKKCFGRGKNVIFIHTGGTPGIFSYANELAGSL